MIGIGVRALHALLVEHQFHSPHRDLIGGGSDPHGRATRRDHPHGTGTGSSHANAVQCAIEPFAIGHLERQASECVGRTVISARIDHARRTKPGRNLQAMWVTINHHGRRGAGQTG